MIPQNNPGGMTVINNVVEPMMPSQQPTVIIEENRPGYGPGGIVGEVLYDVTHPLHHHHHHRYEY